MKYKYIIILFINSILSGCMLSDTNCCDKISSTKISDGIYLEKYRTFCAGVFGELTDCYLTDSLTFRTKIGAYDEHERLIVKFHKNKCYIYNTTATIATDTIETVILSRGQLLNIHHSDNNILVTKSIFEGNKITCNTDYHSGFGDYSIDDNLFITKTQFKCGNSYLNAIYFTDSLTFRVLIGVHEPGSEENNYSVEKLTSDSFAFYNITENNHIDTISTKVLTMKQLKESHLTNVCD